MLAFVFFLLINFFFHHVLCQQCEYSSSEYGVALVGHVYKSFIADRLATCYSACHTQPVCQSFNFNLADNTCELITETKHSRPGDFVEKDDSVYADIPDRR